MNLHHLRASDPSRETVQVEVWRVDTYVTYGSTHSPPNMTFDLASIVSWHNARQNAIQINVSNLQVRSLPVPFWKAKTDARCHFRVQVGVYSEQAAMLAQSRYQTALVEYQIKLEEWHRKKLEAEMAERRDDITSGLSKLANAFTRPHPPATPTEADAVEYHWSKSMFASFSVASTIPACKARSVLSGASDNLFEWITVHSSPTALAGSALSPVEVDAALIKKIEVTVIGAPQDTAIKSRIAAEQFEFLGSYEIQRTDFDHAPGTFNCHVWRVEIVCDGKKATLLVGADGAIFGRHLTVTTLASKVALASFVALSGIGVVWMGASKTQAPSASPPVSVAAPAAAVQQAVAMPLPQAVAASPAPATQVVVEPVAAASAAAVEEASKPVIDAAQAPLSLAIAAPPVPGAHASANSGKAIDAMLISASKKDWAAVVEEAQAIKAAFIQAPRGDRKVARAANTAGLELLSQSQFNEATKMFANAFASDQSDLEILNNLGYSSILAGQYKDGVVFIGMAIWAAPERTSAWANLSEAFAALDEQPEALAAMQLAVLFSANREKTIDYLTGIRATHKSTNFRSVASLALEQIDAVPARGETTPTAPSSSLARAIKIMATN